MKHYDEYQKMIRYKYGYHSFWILMTLFVLNSTLSLFFDIQWAEMKVFETLVILTLASIYYVLMLIYRGAYYTKWQKPVLYSIIYIIMGIVFITLSFSPYMSLFSNGKVTVSIFILITGIFYLAMPSTHLIKLFVERRQNSKDIGGH